MKSPSRRWVLVAVAALVVAAAGYLGWRWWRTPAPVSADAVAANLRGVGLMEQFDFAKATDAFEEAHRLAPGWQTARVNLAIALLNAGSDDAAKLDRSRKLLTEVLSRDPDDAHAHYCLGIIDLHQTRLPDAYRHFDAVSRIDPRDAHTWYHKGITHPGGKASAEAKECFERALKLDPYLNAARYNLAMLLLDGADRERRMRLLAEHKALITAEWETPAKIAYAEMGPYAVVIGKPPAGPAAVGPLPLFAPWEGFDVRLAAGTRWAKAADLGDAGRPFRERFGATLVFLDYDRDGRPDIFLPSAVVRDGKLADLLLQNDGGGVFTDVTAAAGLSGASLGAAVADYDNDGFSDLLLAGVGEARLFRNGGKGRFEDTGAFKGLTGTFLGAAWVDLDQDGDLDLILCRFDEGGKEGGFVVMLNVGEAPPAGPGLTTKFERWKAPDDLTLDGRAVAVAVGDLDGDRDVDLLCLADGRAPAGVWNDRLLRFREAGPLDEPANFNGALLLDVDHDGRSDVLLLPAGKPPRLWLAKPDGDTLPDRFKPGATNSPALRHAHAVDLDRDGWTDVVGLSDDGRPVLLHNDGAGKLVHRADAFGTDVPKADAAAAVDLDGDGHPDLLLLTEGGLVARHNAGNANRTLRLQLSGRRDPKKSLHTNADSVGAWVVAQAGTVWTGMERGTTSAGLGQSSLPVELGIGRHDKADVVRIRWPDGLPQAELNVATGHPVPIVETTRKSTSCPVLFAWDGERYRFVTDFLGGGALGELGPDGSVRPPRPEESLALGSLPAKDGWYQFKVSEPMDEVMYLDHLELVAIDHPAGWTVLPDERFVMNGPPPTQVLLFLTDARPAKARDGRGNDMTERLRERDRRMVDGFRTRSWLGYAEEHTLELDFGPVPKGGRWVLCLDGWTDYPYPESIWAAEQAKVALVPPTLETPHGGGWRPWEELGFPAGLPRTMTRDVTGLIEAGGGRFRVRSNMQVYWDRVRLTRRVAAEEVAAKTRVTALPVGRATLRHRGLAQEMTPDGAPPIGYDPERNESVAVSDWQGRVTRLGDVTELLTRRDDRFVIGGPGDEVEVGFDGRRLPALAPGQARSFVLRTAGYSKDSSPFTKTGGRVEPLPYRAMKSFPPPARSGPAAAAFDEYDRRWNTRRVGR